MNGKQKMKPINSVCPNVQCNRVFISNMHNSTHSFIVSIKMPSTKKGQVVVGRKKSLPKDGSNKKEQAGRIKFRPAVSEDDESDNEDVDEEESDDDEDNDFELQSLSSSDVDEDSSVLSDTVEENKLKGLEETSREWTSTSAPNVFNPLMAQYLHTDDLSSDDEENLNDNTIGRVPLHWYDAYDHVGYTVDGKKLIKSQGPDRIDITLRNADKKGLHTIYDMYNNREVQLSERDIEIIRRMQMGAFAHAEHNDTPDYSDYASSIKEVMPLSAAPEPKRRFVPSKWETMRVIKILKAIKEGKYVFSTEKKKGSENEAENYLIWNEEADEVVSYCPFLIIHNISYVISIIVKRIFNHRNIIL